MCVILACVYVGVCGDWRRALGILLSLISLTFSETGSPEWLELGYQPVSPSNSPVSNLHPAPLHSTQHWGSRHAQYTQHWGSRHARSTLGFQASTVHTALRFQARMVNTRVPGTHTVTPGFHSPVPIPSACSHTCFLTWVLEV